MKHPAVILLAFAWLTGAARATQQGIASISLGDQAGAQYGASLSGLGDVDLDGVPDLIIGAPLEASAGAEAGAVFLVSAKTGELLATIAGDAAFDRFGTAVSGVGDVDGDGYPDYLVGAPYADSQASDGGMARLYSGKTRAPEDTFACELTGAHFGFALAAAGDVDGDGVIDLVVGAPDADLPSVDGGLVRLYSGASGQLLWQLGQGAPATARFGAAVASAGDFDGDGFADVVIGEPGDDAGGPDAGAAQVFSFHRLQVLDSYYGAAMDLVGTAVSSAGDQDGDGRDEYLIGAPGFALGPKTVWGTVLMIRGGTGAVLGEWFGVHDGDDFGASIALAGDVDGDGSAEAIIGAPTEDKDYDQGTAWVVSLSTRLAVLTYQGARGFGAFGRSVSGVGDASGDGIPDLAVGAPLSDENGADAGSVHVFASAHSHRLRTFIGAPGEGLNPSAVGDLNLDGVTDIAATNNYDWTVRVMSGADGATLYTLTGSGSPYTNFGWSVAGGGEVDQDGTPDLVVGDPADNGTRRGSVHLFSGRTGTKLWSRVGTSSEWLGSSVAMVQDVNGDGVDDVLAGAAGYGSPGDAYLFSGVDGAELLHVQGKNQDDRFGNSVATVPDVDGDGVAELVIGAPYTLVSGAYHAGAVDVFSGRTGASLAEFFGAGGENLGWSVAACGDVNQDGVPDIVAAAVVANEARVFSLANHGVLYRLRSIGRGYQPPYQVSGAGDVDADGFDDVALAAAPDGVYRQGPGLALVFSGKTGDRLATFDATAPDAVAWNLATAPAGDLDQDGFADVLLGVPTDGRVVVCSAEQRWLSFQSYGRGWPGTDGIPEVRFRANLFLCTQTALELQNSRGTSTPAWIVVGTARAEIPTAFGGSLLLLPTALLPLSLPAAGATIPFDVPCSSALGGVSFYLQALELDPGASRNVSFTPGLRATFVP